MKEKNIYEEKRESARVQNYQVTKNVISRERPFISTLLTTLWRRGSFAATRPRKLPPIAGIARLGDAQKIRTNVSPSVAVRGGSSSSGCVVERAPPGGVIRDGEPKTHWRCLHAAHPAPAPAANLLASHFLATFSPASVLKLLNVDPNPFSLSLVQIALAITARNTRVNLCTKFTRRSRMIYRVATAAAPHVADNSFIFGETTRDRAIITNR